jgi:hypothetical protein
MKNNVTIINKNDLIHLQKTQEEKSFYHLLNHDFFKNNPKLKSEMEKLLDYFQYLHHNDVNFEKNIKEMFQENLIQGQEDQAGLRMDDMILIFNQSEHGVYISLIIKEKTVNENNIQKLEKILSLLELGMHNPKGFHAMLSYEQLNRQLINKEEISKQIKI